MSRPSDRQAPIVGFVCEGSTDIVVLREVVERLLGPIESRGLQPQTDELDRQLPRTSAGWSAVRAWCEANASSLDEWFDPYLGDPLDLLVVALDLDIAVLAGVEKHPKNLSKYDRAHLQGVVRAWLGGASDTRVVIATPVYATEAWIVAAMYPKHKPRAELLRDPVSVLVAKKRVPMGKSGPWKRVSDYRRFADVVGSKLDSVRKQCAAADEFSRSIERHGEQHAREILTANGARETVDARWSVRNCTSLVGILRDLHDAVYRAKLDAYGFPWTSTTTRCATASPI